MIHPADHVLALILVVALPLRAAVVGFRRLRLSSPERLPAVRLRVYRDAIVIQWSLVIALLIGWSWLGRSWDGLGLRLHSGWGLYGVAIGIVVVVLVIARQRGAALANPEVLGEIRTRMQRIRVMLPHTPGEFRAFAALAVTAGICEEILYRGFMIWYLGAWMAPTQAVAVSALAFGVGHGYQGVRGVVQTGGLGLLLGAIYLVSGTVWGCVVIHALVNLHSGHILMRAYVEEAGERDAAQRQAAAERREDEARAAAALAAEHRADEGEPGTPAPDAEPPGEGPPAAARPPAPSPRAGESA